MLMKAGKNARPTAKTERLLIHIIRNIRNAHRTTLERSGPLRLLQRISRTDRAGRVPRHDKNAAITTLIVVSTHSRATGTASIPTALAMVAGFCSPLAESPCWA